MKPNGQKKGSVAEAPNRNIVTPGTSKVKKCPSRQRGPRQKATDDPGVLSSIATEVFGPQILRNEVTSLDLKSGRVDPSTKIKLQLIPVDEVTRIGLEKDGLNPFLELTLRARKKISSVVKHIHTKWGSSSIALGEPMLFPCNMQLVNPASSTRWTLKDTDVSAGDVHTTVGSPDIFRLSYGWFSDNEPKMVVSSEFESLQKGCTANMGVAGDPNKQIERTEETKWLEVREPAEAVVTEHMDANSPKQDLSIGGLLSEASLQEKIPKSSANKLISHLSIGGLFSEASLHKPFSNTDHEPMPLSIQWDDGLTALSIGGLLSEASLQAKINNSDPKSNEPSPLMSDSFDAILASRTQVAKSSILDAEETCHAFSFRKFSSSTKNVRVSVRAGHDLSFSFPQVETQAGRVEDGHGHEPKTDILPRAHYSEDSRSLGLRGINWVEKQAGVTQDDEPKTDILPRPQHYSEDSRSLGLRGINWNESFGPFDLGLFMPRNGG